MADANVSRLGQVNGAGDDRALFLKQFAGEVLTAFAELNVFLPNSMVRSISSGKSAQFPATWKATASYHTPGTELLGSQINHAERVISIDDLLTSDQFVALIDELMNHYDVRREYSRQAGAALSRTLDKNLAQLGYLAARASATVTGGNGGTVITDGDADTSADSLVTSIFDAAQAMDERDVPDEDRSIFLKPAQYYNLVEGSTKAVHRDFGGEGSIAGGNIFRLAGIPIIKSNNLPTSAITTGPAAYQGDFSTSVGLVWHRSAVGTVKLLDLAFEMGYQIERQGTLMVSKMAVGSGILRPESAVEIKTA